MQDLQIIPTTLLTEFTNHLPARLEDGFNALHDAEISSDSFSFYTSVSSVYSSKIEGEKVELDSYVKHKRFGIEFQPDYTKKVDDLYDAYLFAQSNPLNEKNIAEAHRLLSAHIVDTAYQGKLRIHSMYVTTPDGKIEYVAATPYELPGEMSKFYNDVNVLVNSELKFAEVFFFAAMLHLVFVKIHPWNDGNGRCARLIEKWFLAQKLSSKAWFIQSEKHYYEQHETYYNNVRRLGLEYPSLNYSKALPFLLILPEAVDLRDL